MFNKRIVADYLQKISIFSINRRIPLKWGGGEGPLEWGSAIYVEISTFEGEDNYIHLSNTHRLGAGQFDQEITLTWTYCNFGGKRFWFKCPFCKKRVGVLYRRSEYFACRHCNYLTYESKNLSGKWKKVGRIISIPELEESEKSVKRTYYKGKMTKRYLRHLKKYEKFERAFRANFVGLNDRYSQ